MSAWKKWLPRVLAVVGVALIVLLVWQFGWDNLVSIVASANAWDLTVMTAMLGAGLWLRALKWRIGLGPGPDRFRMFFLAKVAATWTPGRFGEFAPLLAGAHRSTRVAAWIFADRVMEVWMTIAAGLIGALSLPAGSSAWVPVAAIAIVAGSAVVLAGMFLWPLPQEPHPSRVGKTVHAFIHEFRHLGPKLPLLIGITAFVKVLDLWAIVVLFDAFGYKVGFWLSGAARLAHALVSATPLTPDSTGVPYVAAAVFLHENAGVPYDTLTAALSVEIVALYGLLHLCYLAVGGPWLGMRPHKESNE